MTWTYRLDQLTTPLYAVRLALGDTQQQYPLLQDEEILQYLGIYGTANPYYAAAHLAEAIAGLFSRQVDRTVTGLTLSNSQKVAQYLQLAKELRRQAAFQVRPYAGGQSVLDKQTNEQNSDRVPPFFTRTTMEAPGTTLPETGQTANPLIEQPA